MRRPTCGSIRALVVAAALLCAGPVVADPPGYRPGRPPSGHDRYDRYYPPPGHVVHALPYGHHAAHYHNHRYYYGGGVWYRPYGPYFSVVVPPVGIGVSLLPDYYATYWYGGVPYYYANSVYYVRRPYGPGYVVAEPPRGEPERVESSPVVGGDDFYMYPREGQSAETQAQDRYECHRWAVTETGFDPSLAEGGVPESQNLTRRSDYLRAITACLEARGYSVR